ncbi:DUF21 domain-containing protein [candidate division WOR-3 bacterium]|nr:DUF21 domain-containing protein [candidate division WOR-3 bacterium]
MFFIVIFLFLLALFTSSELALVSARTERIAGSFSKRKKTALSLLGNVENNLSAILVGTNICIVAMSTLTERLFETVLKQHNPAYSVLFDFAVILLVGEIIPKSLSKTDPNSAIMNLSVFMMYSTKVLSPFSDFLKGISDKMLYLIGVRSCEERRLSDFENAVRDFARAGLLSPNSKILERGVSALERLKVSSLMKPRKNTVFCREKDGYEGALEAYRKTGHSKIVCHGENPDDIKGVYYIRDWVKKGNKSPRPPRFVYEKTTFMKVLEFFDSMNDDLAVCVDEYGQVSGIITRVDLILCFSSILFLNEKNPFVEGINNEGNYIFKAETKIGLVADLYGLDISREFYDGEHTISSYILGKKRKIPSPKERIEFEGLLFTIEESSVREVKSVSVKKLNEE